MATTRVIFQNLNLFVGPAGLSGNSATGQLYADGDQLGANLVAQLSRVQSATLNVGINRQDILEFGQADRIDSLIMSPPNFGLDWTHYLTDGMNEKYLGFNINGGAFLSGILTQVADSKNYFIATSPQGVDDNGYVGTTDREVWGLGNGFISNYSINLSVGQPAQASVSVEALNVKTYTSSSGNLTPAVYPSNSQAITDWHYHLPVGDAITGASVPSALRPGDIQLTFPEAGGFLVPISGDSAVNVQSVSLSVPMSREVLQRLGSPLGFSREITLPITASMQIRAMATDIRADSFTALYANDQTYDFTVRQNKPGSADAAVILGFRKAKVTNFSKSDSIGSNSTVDITATTTIQGSNATTGGVTFSGAFAG